MALDERALLHIKAVADEIKPHAEATEKNPVVQAFSAGLLAGIGIAARIADGGTAQAAVEELADKMAAAVGRAYLDGNLPGAPTTP